MAKPLELNVPGLGKANTAQILKWLAEGNVEAIREMLDRQILIASGGVLAANLVAIGLLSWVDIRLGAGALLIGFSGNLRSTVRSLRDIQSSTLKPPRPGISIPITGLTEDLAAADEAQSAVADRIRELIDATPQENLVANFEGGSWSFEDGPKE